MELITYETVRNAHRAEKEEELQKLPDGFFESIRNWFKVKAFNKSYKQASFTGGQVPNDLLSYS